MNGAFSLGPMAARRRASDGTIANAAALSPNYKHDALVLSNGNLTATHSATDQWEAVATIHADPTKKFYCEVTINAIGAIPQNTLVGVGNYLAPIGGTYLGQNGNSAAYRGTGAVLSPGSGSADSGARAFTTGDVIGVSVDGPNGAVHFNKNGGSSTGTHTPTAGGPLFLILMAYNANVQFTVNFGATPFAFPVPNGYEPWHVRDRTNRYWRIYTLANNTAQAGFSEIELREAPGGENFAATVGTQTQKNTWNNDAAGFGPDNAVDGDFSGTTGAYVYNLNNSGANWWWQKDFGAGNAKKIDEAKVSVLSHALQYPTNFRLLDSPDGVNFFPEVGKYAQVWTQGETRTYTNA